MSAVTLSQLNRMDRDGFVAVCGPLFEGSPWIAERTWRKAPFGSVEELLKALVGTMGDADTAHKLKLIRAHPDLVGRLAREGRLTLESTREQAAAGLDRLSPEEIALFDRYNTAYKERFAFPFVICARENKKEAILASFPQRLGHTEAQEMDRALDEIGKIARLRLLDAVEEE